MASATSAKKLPRIFIASSGAGLPLARAVKEYLAQDGRVDPCAWWDLDAFPLGEHTLESLEKAAHSCEAAIIVFTPDDRSEKKGEVVFSPRDNVIFEAGLFMSAFGRRRVAIVRSKAAEVLTDLDGVARLDLDPASNTADYDKLDLWIDNLLCLALPDLVLACASDAIRKWARPPLADARREQISFPYPAYPGFLLRLLRDHRIKIDAVEAISTDLVSYFRDLPRLGPYAATDYRDFHWYLWDQPCATQMLASDKESILNATKVHRGVSRTIIVPQAVPALMHSALLRYADEMEGARSSLRFAVQTEPIAEGQNRMMLSLGDKSFRASRLTDPETNARTVQFVSTEDARPVFRGSTVEPRHLRDSLKVLCD